MRLSSRDRDNPWWTILLGGLLAGALLVSFWQRSRLLPSIEQPDVTQMQLDVALPSVQPPRTIGQQFVAKHPNLSAIELVVVVHDESTSDQSRPITFHLHRDDANGPPVTEVTMDTRDFKHNQVWRISFPPQRESAGQTYYFWLEGSPENKVSLWYSTLDAYQEGQHYADHQPAAGDLAFSTHYTYDADLFLHELDDILGQFGCSTLLTILVLLLPGGVLTLWFFANRKLDGLERLALTLGLSLAFFPILFLWATVLHGRLGRSWLIAIYVLFILGLIFWLIRRIRSKSWEVTINRPSPATIVGFIFLLLILVLRLVQIRELLAPPGVDAPHHALIATLVSDYGRVPRSFYPMLPIENARYHFGFHTTAAATNWLTGDSLNQTILVLGQILNAAICLGIYFFANRLTGQRMVALLSLILTGLVSPFPAHYLTWGRYTAVAGILLLTVTLGVTIMLFKRPGYSLLIAGVLLWSGLFLTHYNMLVTAMCFLLVYTLYTAWLKRQATIPQPSLSAWLVALASLSLILSLPWLYHVLFSRGVERLAMLISLSPNEGLPYFGMLAHPSFPWIFIPGGAGMLYGLWKKQDWVVLLWLWLLAAGTFANARVFGFLRVFILNNAAFILVVFIPIVILAGYALLSGYQQLKQTLVARPGTRQAIQRLHLAIGFSTLLLLAGIAWQQVPLLDRTEISVTEMDMAAMDWIRENTPEEAVFLTNAWHQPGQMILGTDAGVWIPMLTGRQATLPPITVGQGSAAYKTEVRELVQAVQEAVNSNTFDAPEVRQMLAARGVSHVYLGAKPGLVTPAMLRQSPYYKLVFSNGPVSIFEFQRSESAAINHDQLDKCPESWCRFRASTRTRPLSSSSR